MVKINDAVKRQCKDAYEKGCNTYLLALANAWEWDCKAYGYWVADEVGGVFSYGESIFINMDDIVYCVENDIQEKEYVEHQDYNVRANEFGFDLINLQSWHKGAPRVSDETFKKFEAMKRDLNDAINQEKENQKKGKPTNSF